MGKLLSYRLLQLKTEFSARKLKLPRVLEAFNSPFKLFKAGKVSRDLNPTLVADATKDQSFKSKSAPVKSNDTP